MRVAVTAVSMADNLVCGSVANWVTLMVDHWATLMVDYLELRMAG